MDTLSSRTLFVKLSEPQPLGALGIPPIGRGFIEDRKAMELHFAAMARRISGFSYRRR